MCKRGTTPLGYPRIAGTTPPEHQPGTALMKGFSMSWILLTVAGLFEIAWAIGLKYTDGFSRLWPSIGTLGAMVASVLLLGVAMKELPVGTAYAVWTGIGAVGTAVLGILLFGDSASTARLTCLAMIGGGIVGLKMTS